MLITRYVVHLCFEISEILEELGEKCVFDGKRS